jgi:hypothetical protein
MDVFISVACSATIALIGWNVLFSNAKKLASRSESYTLVTKANDILKEIKKESDDFWLDESKEKSPIMYDTSIALKLREVQQILKILGNREVSCSDVSKTIYQVRRACTLSSPKIQTMDSEEDKAVILRAIYGVIAVCENEIYTSFMAKYPPN